MNKCPKCGHWTVELDYVKRAILCHRLDCNYKEPVDVDKYLKEHSILPKLAESLKVKKL